MAILTPSDGVHLYLLTGDDGPSITNRGNLPDHVDVRGLGGYVIAPPSVLSRRAAVPLAPARADRRNREGAAALLEVLRERKGANSSAEKYKAPAGRLHATSGFTATMPCASTRWPRSTRSAGCSAAAPMGERNNQINARASCSPAGRRRRA
jgi:putative DNA primase/helicase